MKKLAFKERLKNDYESDEYFLDEVYDGPLEEPIIVEYEFDVEKFRKYIEKNS